MTRSRVGRGRSGHIPAEALVLRSWALHLLGTRSGPPESLWQAAARCGLPSWHLFLRLESCALALQSRLDASGSWPRLPAEIAALIRNHALGELRRVLSARAQIKGVAQLAADRGWQAMVLKGGVAVAAGELIDLGDVDVLVAADRVHDFAAALGEVGYEQHGIDTETMHHLAARITPNGLRIEVHRSLKGGAELDAFLPAAIPLAGEPTLLRQGPVDHLRYLLLHATLQHPERTGRIRDLLLIGHALRSCSPEEIVEVERELAEHEAGERIVAFLRLARALNETVYLGDPFEGLALRVYILFHRFGWLGRDRRLIQLLVQAAMLVARGRRYWWESYVQFRGSPTSTPSSLSVVAWIQSRSRRVGVALRHLVRLLTFGGAIVSALSVVGEARWIEARRGPVA